MNLRRLMSLLLAGGLIIPSSVAFSETAYAEETPIQGISATVPRSSDPKIRAWQDMQYGLFIHWGVYSTFAGYYKGQKQWLGYPEQIKAWGINSDEHKVTDEDYIAAAQAMDIPDFNAQQWCQTAKDTGMKYLLITSKHHDGFAMWNTKTTDYNFTHHSPTHRDPLKELADACNDKGVKLAFYFSIIDWTKHPAEPYRNANAIPESMIPYMKAQLTELLSGKYGTVPELWFDMGGPTAAQSEELANHVRTISPTTVINSRVWNDKGDFEVGGDNELKRRLALGPWESIKSIFPECWGYCTWPDEEAIRNSADGVRNKAAEEIGNLFNTVAFGGQYLLNVGPRGSGDFHPFEMKVLKEMGKWRERHPAITDGGHATYYPQQEWGNAVINGNNIYLGVSQWPQGGGEITLPGAAANVTAVSVDGPGGQALNYRVEGHNLIITLPAEATDPILPVIKVETSSAPTYIPSITVEVSEHGKALIPSSQFQTVDSPKNTGPSRVIGYALSREASDNARVSVRGNLNAETRYTLTVGDTSKTVTGAQLTEGVDGFTLTPNTVTPITVAPAEGGYFATPLARRNPITSMRLVTKVVDPADGITVQHRFVSANDTALPNEVLSLLPDDDIVPAGTSQVRPSVPEATTATVKEGTWTFAGWDRETENAPGKTVTFTGRWTFELKQFDMRFRYYTNSNDPMPDTVMSTLPEIVKAPYGSAFTAPQPSTTSVATRTGTWVFVGWDRPTLAKVQGKNTFYGRWDFQPNKPQIVFAFASSDDERALPTEVTTLLPQSQEVTRGETVALPALETTTVTTPEGVWTFDGWTPGSLENVTTNVSVVGSWTFAPAPHQVTYRFVPQNDELTLPSSIEEMLPGAESVEHGAIFDAQLPAKTHVDTIAGRWFFLGWDLSHMDAVGEDTVITGQWGYAETEYAATYVFDASVPQEVRDLMPTGKPVVKGDLVCAPEVVTTEVPVTDGAWIFGGWEKECYTFEEVQKIAAQAGAAPVAGAGFRSAANAEVISLPFVPQWKFQAKPVIVPAPGGPSVPAPGAPDSGAPSRPAVPPVVTPKGTASTGEVSVPPTSMNKTSQQAGSGLARTGASGAPAAIALGCAFVGLVLSAAWRRQRR